jgi:sugar porter (SP) family MFS transporter
VGISSILTPLYLAEAAPARNRGALVSLAQLAITIGIMVSYFVGYVFAAHSQWRWMLGLGAVPGAILALGMLVLPESPRWLAGHGRLAEAGAVLRRLRGGIDIGPELADLKTDLQRETRLASWGELLNPIVRRPLIVGIGLAMFQQITGINTVIYFAPTIFEAAGLSSASAAILATAGVGTVNVALTIVAMWLVDRVGRRALLLTGLVGMSVCLFLLAGGFVVGKSVGELSWITAISLGSYVGFFAIGLGPVFWLLIAEIFPLYIRGRAMGAAAISNWLFNLLVSVTFLDMVNAFGEAGTFLVYTITSVVGFFFVRALVPETKGRSLEQIEGDLHRRAVS